MLDEDHRGALKLILFFAAFIAFGVWLVYTLPEGPTTFGLR